MRLNKRALLQISRKHVDVKDTNKNGRRHLLAFWSGSALPRSLKPSGKVGRMDAGLLTYKQSLARFTYVI
jgi:hypothetical protein